MKNFIVMNKLLINLILSFCMFFITSNVNAMDYTTSQKNNISDKGSIILKQLLLSHQMLANAKQSDPINEKIQGSIVLLGEKKYELVSFKFKNKSDQLLENSFENYAKENNLLNMKSVVDSSKEGSIILEIFDSEKANLDNDDISFYISLRPLN